MAMTAVESWSGGFDSNSDQKGYVTQTASRSFTIVSTDPANDTEVTAVDALAAIGVTTNLGGSVHPRLGTAFQCKKISISKKTPVLYEATANYQTPQFDSQNPGEIYPWNQPAVISTYDIDSEEPVDEDADGDPLVTANDEPVEGLTRNVSDMGIQIQRAFLTFSIAGYYTYKNKVNSDTFLGCPPGVLRIVGLPATPAWFDGQLYYNVTCNIAARVPYNVTSAEAWYFRFLHAGYKVYDPVIDGYYRGVDDFKMETAKPACLAANGMKLNEGDTKIYLTRRKYESVAFSGMGFF